MPVSISSPVIQTIIFAGFFCLAFLLLLRERKDLSFFPVSVTTELKGLAILMIIFGHLGYFLFTDHRFLYPLSVTMGVGVDLFLFLSGFGLVASALKKRLTINQFYVRRLARIYLPLWIVMLILVPLDIFVLQRQYDLATIVQIALGWIKHADLFNDFNSPLWFISLIVFYYLLFPLIFWRKVPELSAVIFYLAGLLILKFNPLMIKDVRRLYELHFIAFPLGVLIAALAARLPEAGMALQKWLEPQTRWDNIARLVVFVILIYGALYFSLYSGMGTENYIVHTISLLTVGLYVGIFLIKKTEWKLFTLFGRYSYEVYLLHWPLCSRYDWLFHHLPAGLATAIFLILILGLGFLLHQLITKISHYMGF